MNNFAGDGCLCVNYACFPGGMVIRYTCGRLDTVRELEKDNLTVS